ncbi:hypothetical protein [uncultured Thiothrix sp.]|uniref:hypothetical protein n=1 Tax=uncultured Thiothrix sp. TaxID=223185 RepID=UPI00260C97C9|nr:hypothetical protein [uncultured Thiothrix sp.]
MESVLHKHYKAGERLFSNTLGELFLGRDLQATTNQRFLIHYLPRQLLSNTALKQSLSSLQNLGHKANTSVLKVLDGAWSETEVFFVMEVPKAWSLTVLPALQGQPTNLHQKALDITQQLIEQGLVTKGLDSSLFLVAPTGDLHLLGTSFLTELQTLADKSPNLLQPQAPVPINKRPSVLPLILLGGAGLVAASSLGLYQFANLSKPVPVTVASPVMISELDKPLVPNELNTHLETAIEPTKPIEPINLAVAAKLEPMIAPVETTKTQETLKPVSISATKIKEPDLVEPTTQVDKTKPLASSVVILSSSITQVPTTPPSPQAGMHLERASEAIKNGHLQTGLYYLRLAKKLNASQEQLKNMAKQLIEQARLTGAASEMLSPQMQTSIKQEFGLE